MQLKLTAFTLGSGKLFFYGKRPLKNQAWFLCYNTVKPEYSDTKGADPTVCIIEVSTL